MRDWIAIKQDNLYVWYENLNKVHTRSGFMFSKSFNFNDNDLTFGTQND